MATAQDVAAYILRRTGSISTWKLQKLVYYSQAWHLAWEEQPLFDDRIEAWANGPVVPALYRDHRGKFTVRDGEIPGDGSGLADHERETVDIVLRDYGDKSGRLLSQLTHAEDPWRQARGELAPTASSNAEITPASMFEFYSALDADGDALAVDDIDWE